MFVLLMLVACLVWVVYSRLENRKIVELSRKLPGDLPSWPILGHAYLLRGSDEDQMRVFQKSGRLTINRGGLASYWVANRLYIMVADPSAAEVILKNCLDKDYVMKFLQFLVGNGSIYAPVSIWRPRRKLVAPTFSMKNLNRFVEVFARQSAVMVDQIGSSAGRGTFSVWKFLTTYTFDAVCETTLGVQMRAQLSPNQAFLDALEQITQLVATRMVQPWLYADSVYSLLPQYKRAEECRRLMYDFVEQVIKTKRMEMEQRSKTKQSAEVFSPQCFLEMLLESSQLSDHELAEEAMVISVAGTDTSAVAASFTVLMLSRHPEIQDRVYEELCEVLGDSNRDVTAEDLPRLKYLEAVIKETLRLYPPVPIIVRSVEQDTELPSGLTLVKGVGIVINIWAMHRNPRYWGQDADMFRPERFLGALQHPAQFMPFSYGLRNCLGYQYAMMSIKTVLATLFCKYRALPPEGADQAALKEPLRVKFDIMMKDVNKFQIQLENRF
ncbi:cytochrome P450 4d2-like isoform X2 [Leguminivora glycinivorella]|uniref:cytochrome P450 4d2-like isoform X2 n=1 Tax=Leguminivora glycinivorella TaxID=1035111 RepID=UPI00200F9C4E|nr:cytochrome P450 4d2-like isoform X2 [Leguminivora glycinivorella]